MGLFILLFLLITGLEFFLVSFPGRWRFLAVTPRPRPSTSGWTGKATGPAWSRRPPLWAQRRDFSGSGEKTGTAERDVRPCIST